MNLDEITQKEEFVLFDSSTNNIGDFLWDIYPCRNYTQMDYNSIINVQERLLSFFNFVTFENTFTVKQVLEEIYCLQEKLSEKAVNLNRTEKEFKDVLKRKKVKIDIQNKKEYNTLLFIVNNLVKKTRKKILKIPDNLKYKMIYDSVLDLKKRLGLTKNFCFHKWENQPKIFENNEDKYTDENLVATLFYMSIVEDKTYALVSRDYGITRLVNEFNRLIYSNNSITYQYLKESLKQSPVRIYMPYKHSSSNYMLILPSNDKLLMK